MVLPKGKPAGETHAYSLEEIGQMLKAFPRTSLDDRSCHGIHWSTKRRTARVALGNYDGQQVLISQSFWRGHELEPKTRGSKAPFPVITQLAQRLERHRYFSGNPANGLMFLSAVGKPINLDALAADVIIPLVNKTGIEWHSWHGFRRGLATNLHQLGVADKTIQRILRHANVAVTQNCYIKTAALRSRGGDGAV